MHLFTYSAREGTAATRMPRHVSKAIKKERLSILTPIAQQMKATFFQQMLGSKEEVLWERDIEKLENERIRWKGYTRNYVRVSTITDSTVSLFNQITPVTLTNVFDDSLFATLDSVTTTQ